jgi:hypothetical protein
MTTREPLKDRCIELSSVHRLSAYVLAHYPLNEIRHWTNQKPCGFPTKTFVPSPQEMLRQPKEGGYLDIVKAM